MRRRSLLSLVLTLVASLAWSASPLGAQGPPPGRGPSPEMRADQEVFHYLLSHHDKIRRKVVEIPGGVETITESDDKAVVAKLREHAVAMRKRVEEGRGLRHWDPLFAAIFQKHTSIKMSVENTEHGVKVRETADAPEVVALVRAHAEVVSRFVAEGFDEAHRQHAVPTAAPAAKPTGKLLTPVVPGYGGIVWRPDAVDPPRAGAKVLLDATADSKPADVNKGLERAARLLNLYGAAGLKSTDVKIVIVLHGDATKAALADAAYARRFEVEKNPNLPLVAALRQAGVEVLVCGQALNYKQYGDDEVAESVRIAASALTAIANRQQDGYAYVPIP